MILKKACCSILGAALFAALLSHGEAQTVPSATIDAAAAVEAVSSVFTPNPITLVAATGKSLPTTGSWGVVRHISDTWPAACQSGETSCIKVVYRVPEVNIVCSWIVGYDAGPKPGTAPVELASKPEASSHAVILTEDDNAAQYTMLKNSMPGKPFHPIKTVAPEYPLIARNARVSGRVVVEMVVDSTGVVKQVSAVSGPPMLQPAAIAAVKDWQFEPTTVGDKKTSFRMYASFNMSSSAVRIDQGMGQSGVMLVGPRMPGQTPAAAATSPNGAVMVQCGATGCSSVGAPSAPR